MTSKGFVMAFSEGTLDVLARCERMVADAKRWLHSGEWMDQLGIELGTKESAAFYEVQSRKCDEMEHSLHLCVSKLMTLAGSSGGMEVFTDGEDSLFWRTATGFHGGMIFHSNRYGNDRIKTGSWSLHT